MAKQSSDSAKTSTTTEGASGSTRRQPSNISKIFDSGDVETVQREFRALYGYDQSAQFISDLMAFVEKVKRGDYVE